MNAVTSLGIACPFCGLVCDDLGLAEGRVDTRGCAKAASGFARQTTVVEHRVGGRPASLDQAAAAAASLLSAARQPLITGLAADLAGLRALVALGDRIGAIVDRWRSAPQAATLGLVQREGALTTTFGEIANRADVVLLLGRDPTADQPRFFERLLRNRGALYRAAVPHVTFLGPETEVPGDPAVTSHIAVGNDHLLDALTLLAAMVGGSRHGAAGDLPIAPLATLAERLAAARYGAIIWDIAAFPAAAREPAATILLHMLRRLTRKTRCVGLPLGGADNAQGASQTMLWQAGWPGRLSFASGAPRHDRWTHDAERLVAAHEIDALLWVDALAPTTPPAAGVPTVALLAADAPEASAEVEIRVGIPGLDHGGAVTRADTVVALPLTAARPTTQPSVAAAASAILAHLGGAA